MARVITRARAEELKREGRKLTKQEAGSLGGQSTLKKYGMNFLRANAVRGNLAFRKKYKWVKLGTSDWALTIRATGEFTGKTINGNIIPPRVWKP